MLKTTPNPPSSAQPNSASSLVSAIFKGFSALAKPQLFFIFLLSVIMTGLSMVLFIGSIAGFLFSFDSGGSQWEWLIDWGGSILGFVLAWALFPATMLIIVGFFYERIASVIEAEDYPDAPPAPDQPLGPSIWDEIKFAMRIILLNLLCLPLYFIPLLNIIIYYWLNGHMFGREFFHNVAARHLGPQEANLLRKKHGTPILVAGCLIAFGATIPIVNLLVPFVGIATMVHFYQLLDVPEEELPIRF